MTNNRLRQLALFAVCTLVCSSVLATETPRPAVVRKADRVVLTTGRLELVVDTKAGINPCSLRDLENGQVYADGNYVWPDNKFPKIDGERVIVEQPDGSRSVHFRGRLGEIVVEQTFKMPANEPGAIIEQIKLTNPTDKSVATADFKCGFAKNICDNKKWSQDADAVRFCPVPYRRETDGKFREFPLREVAAHGMSYSGWQEPEYPTSSWGAEGWVWTAGTTSFLIAKYNPDAMEWSLMEPVSRDGKTVVRFGGVGQWKHGHPETATNLAPGKSVTYGETRYQIVPGDWKQAFYAYRNSMAKKGCGAHKGYDPPVHWNELFDNEYFFKACPIANLKDFSQEANKKFLQEFYTLDQMKAEAAKAKELGCEALYMDPGWDTGMSHHIWDVARLGSMESFVKMLKDDYGLRISLWISLGGAPPTFADPAACPENAQVVDKDGRRTKIPCVSSAAFRKTKETRLLELCRQGAAFLMFDSTSFPGSCYDKTHGHSVPSTRGEHAESLLKLLEQVKSKYPRTLIEVHDFITGPSSIHYTPTYFGYARPNSFDCLWGHEFMWNSLDDLLSGRAKSLYYYNLAYDIPLYLHVSLKPDNKNALIFWWYASVCRHLGVGGKPASADVWEADKRAMKTYLSLKRFYTQGVFYGLDETVHAHTLPDLRESVINVFNLDDKRAQNQLQFRLSEIGLPSGKIQIEGAPVQQSGDDVTVYLAIPKRGHRLLKVTMAPEAKSSEPVFFKAGTTTPEDFASVQPSQTFDVVNTGEKHMMLAFERNPDASFSPNVVRLSPGERKTVAMTAASGIKKFSLNYAVSYSASPFKTHANRYRDYNDGETIQCVPVAAALCKAMQKRSKNICDESKSPVTDKAMPAGTYVYTPGPFYRDAGVFARDFLYQLEGSGRDTVTEDEVKRAVDFMALKQLTANKVVGKFTFPKGAIPDHIYPDGQYSWGPGGALGDVNAHFNRPSLDEAFCFVTLAWHYGHRANWDAEWQSWFKANSQRFADAWQSAPRNRRTGLVTQWTTKDHIGANGIAETNGACVTWGFHDSYGLPGDDLGTSVLACNAARALADMHDHVADSASAKQWSKKADAMRDAIRAQFINGYLPWGIGKGAPEMASPDITGYAVWSGILTDAQADAASDWFAERYAADKKAGGAADLFHMTPGCRGAVRMARKADDRFPGSHVWPHVDKAHWENLAFGYNAYQDGGYWYYKSLGIAAALWRKHPAEAREWAANIHGDMAAGNAHHPYERIDGEKPVNDRYNASIGQLAGIGMPAETHTLSVSIADKK